MLNRSQLLVSIIAMTFMGSFSFAKTEGKAGPNLKRKVAAEAFSGSRIGSSGLLEVGTLDQAGMKIDVARVEATTQLKKLNGGRVSLVQVDSGGSTDISSAMASSSLYLVLFTDGEMNNTKAAFALGGINSFTVKSLKNSILTVELNCKDDRLQPIKVESKINFAKFEKEFLNAKASSGKNSDEENFDDILPTGTITMTKKCLPDFQ
ncbi:MAG: hypothetical protein J7501_09180 [Bdellovibrio sp.]|nr:hypothetical protein [Bdellovibrio sp.]